MKPLNIAIIGTQFMGKAHSNAWRKAPRFFDLPVEPVLKVACGQKIDTLKRFAHRWGWEETETDWRQVITREEIDVVAICVPTALHAEIAIEAAKAGKHIFCEKPIALSYSQAQELEHKLLQMQLLLSEDRKQRKSLQLLQLLLKIHVVQSTELLKSLKNNLL